MHIEIASDGTCQYDWLEIEDKKYCGEGELETPFTIITSTNNVDVTFVSDEIIPKSGFLAIWKPATVSNNESARHKQSGLKSKDSQTDKGKEGGKGRKGQGKGRKGQGKGRNKGKGKKQRERQRERQRQKQKQKQKQNVKKSGDL